MVENIGGIQSDGPAYKHIIIAPQPDDKLAFADTTYDSIRGPIETHWKKVGQYLKLKVTIPANTTATIAMPAADVSSVLESGRQAERVPGVKFLRMDGGAAMFEVASGSYDFETK